MYRRRQQLRVGALPTAAVRHSRFTSLARTEWFLGVSVLLTLFLSAVIFCSGGTNILQDVVQALLFVA
jgi:hypothetical protein